MASSQYQVSGSPLARTSTTRTIIDISICCSSIIT